MDPLWRLTSIPVCTLVPSNNTGDLCTGNTPGTWTLSNLLLLPTGRNLAIGFGMAVSDLFSCKIFLLQQATQHGQSIAFMHCIVGIHYQNLAPQSVCLQALPSAMQTAVSAAWMHSQQWHCGNVQCKNDCTTDSMICTLPPGWERLDMTTRLCH